MSRVFDSRTGREVYFGVGGKFFSRVIFDAAVEKIRREPEHFFEVNVEAGPGLLEQILHPKRVDAKTREWFDRLGIQLEGS